MIRSRCDKLLHGWKQKFEYKIEFNLDLKKQTKKRKENMDLVNQNTFSVYKLTVLFLPPFVGTLLYILAHYFHVQISGDSATRKSSPQGNIKCLILRTSQK